MWFDTWSGVVRVLAVESAAYVALIVVLGVSGERTLSELNAFDLILTVALGSTLATILLSSTVAWTDVVTAFASLAALRLVVAAVASRFPAARNLLTKAWP